MTAGCGISTDIPRPRSIGRMSVKAGRTACWTTSLTTSHTIDSGHAADVRSENTHSMSGRSSGVTEGLAFRGLPRELRDKVPKS